MRGVRTADKRRCNGMVRVGRRVERWEVVSSGFMRSVVRVESRVRRGFRSPARGYINEQSIVDTLTVSIIGVDDPGYRLVGLEGPACLLLAVAYLQSQVWGVELTS